MRAFKYIVFILLARCIVFVLFVIFTLIVSCKSHQSKENTVTTDFYSVLEIPDSLLTAEQDSLKRELVDVMINHLEYKEDKVVFLLTKEEFVKKSFAPEYYDITVNNIKIDNKIRKTSDSSDWEKLINDKIQEYKNEPPEKEQCEKNDSEQDLLAGTYLELQKFTQKPDSLLTDEEKVKRDKLFNLILEKVTVKDNQFYSSATPKDFIDKGLSQYYYDILEKSLRESNQWVKDENITNLDSMVQSSKISFLKKE